jgi:hypothetical protein
MTDEKELLCQRLLDHEDELDGIHKRAIGLGLAIRGAFEGAMDDDGRGLSQLAYDLDTSIRKVCDAFKAIRADADTPDAQQ